jgi:predicted transcriptional regulator
MERRVTTTIRLPETLHEEIKRLAEQGDRSLNMQLLRLIRWGLERERGELLEQQKPDQAE